MTQQTFAVGTAPRIVISYLSGDLSVDVWDERSIAVETDGTVNRLYQEGDALIISNCDEDVELKVPSDCAIEAEHIEGSVNISGVRRVELSHVSDDVELEDISEIVEAQRLEADVTISNVPRLTSREGFDADVTLRAVSQVEIEHVSGDLDLKEAQQVVVGTVGGDLDADTIAESLRCGTVGGDCSITRSNDAVFTFGTIGGDLDINAAERVQIASVGSDAELRNINGDVEIGNVGSDLSLNNVGGDVKVGQVGSDASLRDLRQNVDVANIGSDLSLQAAFPAGSRARLNVSGDASVTLPNNPNLSINARAGGSISGQAVAAEGSSRINLVYGEGAAELDLHVGGDLSLRGGGSPRSSASSSWSGFEADIEGLGREMADLGRELGRLGKEIGREIADAFSQAGWSRGAEITDDIARKIDEKMRRLQQRAEAQARRAEERVRHAEERARRHAEEQVRRAEERASRVRVRINEREWQLDPERLDRIKEQARRAAAEGLSGAMEAVERAIGKMRIPSGGPERPERPVPPVPPVVPVPPVPPTPPATGQTIRIHVEDVPPHPAAEQQRASGDAAAVAPPPRPADIERERETILRMIAEGRITPEEGDLLLESLGS